MWEYLKQLEYPIRIRKPDARAAKIILSQYGGPNGELGASLRYLAQKHAMTDRRVAGLLNDIGTEDIYCAYKNKEKRSRQNCSVFSQGSQKQSPQYP